MATSVNQLHRHLVSLIGRETPIVRAPKRPGDVHLACFDCARARQELGWVAQTSLEEGLRMTVAYFREQQAPQPAEAQS